MVWRRSLLSALLLASLAGTAPAGIIFNRHKSNPKDAAKPDDQAAELVRAIRTDPDEHRRAVAAQELAKFDLKAHPQVGPALADALQKDPSAMVRSEAADALGRLRPLTSQANHALEQALAGDTSTQVRGAARSALAPYRQFGTRPGAVPDLAASRPLPPTAQPTARAMPKQPTRPGQPPQRHTAEPPLASSSPSYGPINPVVIPPAHKPAAKSPMIDQSPATKAPAKLNLTPSSPALPKPAKTEDDGPILNPPG